MPTSQPILVPADGIERALLAAAEQSLDGSVTVEMSIKETAAVELVDFNVAQRGIFVLGQTKPDGATPEARRIRVQEAVQGIRGKLSIRLRVPSITAHFKKGVLQYVEVLEVPDVPTPPATLKAPAGAGESELLARS